MNKTYFKISKMKKPELSIVLPCYNESGNIPIVVERFSKFWPKINFELIMVNNGSTDDSAVVLQDMEGKYSEFLRTVTIEKNIGYGHGIMAGLKEATSDVVAYSHADIQTPPEDVIKAYRLINERGIDINKSLIKGMRINRRKEERFLSKGMEIFASLILCYRMKDINSQPKLFSKSFIEKLTNPVLDFSFDVYVLLKALQNGLNIYTFPVDFGLRIHGESKWAASFFSKHKTVMHHVRNILILGVKEKTWQLPFKRTWQFVIRKKR